MEWSQYNQLWFSFLELLWPASAGDLENRVLSTSFLILDSITDSFKQRQPELEAEPKRFFYGNAIVQILHWNLKEWIGDCPIKQADTQNIHQVVVYHLVGYINWLLWSYWIREIWILNQNFANSIFEEKKHYSWRIPGFIKTACVQFKTKNFEIAVVKRLFETFEISTEIAWNFRAEREWTLLAANLLASAFTNQLIKWTRITMSCIEKFKVFLVHK